MSGVSPVVSSLTHRRIQIEFDGGFDDFARVVVDHVAAAADHEDCESFYYFREAYADAFEHHVQVDLLVTSESPVAALTTRLDDHDRAYIDAGEIGSVAWWGATRTEREILYRGHQLGAQTSLPVLEAYLDGDLEHTPQEMARRRFHLIANQHGATYKDELRIALARAVRLIVLVYLGKNWYKRIW